MSLKTDPRILRTRNLLLNALFELLKDNDINDISVGEIADAATLNRATLYDHYRDKYELFEELIGDMFHSKVTRKFEVATDCTRALQTIIEGTFEFLVEMGLSCTSRSNQSKSLIEVRIQKYLFEILYDYKTEKVKSKTHFELELEATAMSWSIFGIGMNWVHNDSQRSIEDYVDCALKVLQQPLLESKNMDLEV